ncbi:MAG: class SAM-dependent methyltransferase [Gemmatimonadetes bacterium]|nr:class SAM-dependent methyltransferase [Gemmatimonadota bacterium]
MSAASIARLVCPPILLNGVASARQRLRRALRSARPRRHDGAPLEQDLELYWNEHWARSLETWGEGTAWNEIELLLANVDGKVLDIACGTGRVSHALRRFPNLELYGCDISDMLIGKAHARGLPPERFIVCDATATPYDAGQFDYGYSIGSLEHFTEPGILQFIDECERIIRVASFHHIPIARDGRDHGWITTAQSYFNNSVDWWLKRFAPRFPHAYALDSGWGDRISVGKWIICPTGRRA